jgi:hypothetical protein
MKTTLLFIVFCSIALPLRAGWLVAKDFTRITYSWKQGEGHVSFDEALKELSKGNHIQKLVVIDLFLSSDEALQNELFAGLASDASRELKEALASSGNMHNPKIQQLWKPFEKALLATPTMKRLSASLAVHGLTISRVSCEKFSLISTPITPKRHFFGTVWLDITKSVNSPSAVLMPREVPWTPETPYCYD